MDNSKLHKQCDAMNANMESLQNHFVTSLFRLAQQKDKMKENPLLIKYSPTAGVRTQTGGRV